MAITQLVERRVSDQKLMALGSIRNVAMRCCVLRKDIIRLFSVRAKQSKAVAVARLDKKLANRTQKRFLCVGLVR